jgi:hypothetical protein
MQGRLQGPTKRPKPLRYGPFDIVEQINENTFVLRLPSYMQMSFVVNVE